MKSWQVSSLSRPVITVKGFLESRSADSDGRETFARQFGDKTSASSRGRRLPITMDR
jgi:hypothetical protein